MCVLVLIIYDAIGVLMCMSFQKSKISSILLRGGVHDRRAVRVAVGQGRPADAITFGYNPVPAESPADALGRPDAYDMRLDFVTDNFSVYCAIYTRFPA